MKARKERLIKVLNCFEKGVGPLSYFMLLPVKVVELYWMALFSSFGLRY